jgi:hypothetical protein
MRSDVTKLYEEKWGWSDYQPMIDAFGNVVIQDDVGSYQGDTFVLYDDGKMIGYLEFGWGSCSGCDALRACSNIREVQELCNELQDAIKWFDDKKQALEWFEAHDWKGDWCWRENDAFVEKCKFYLKGENR